MELRPGGRAKSAVCDTEIVVVKPGGAGLVISCGGHPMVEFGAEKPSGLELAEGHANATAVGKRYLDEASGAEVLCAKGGAGSLSINGRPLTAKETKALPASD